MADFYGDKAKAAELGGVSETDITNALVEIVNGYIDSEIRTDGFGSHDAVEYIDIDDNNKKEIMLKKYPVIDDGNTEIIDNFQNTPVTLDPDSYIIDSETGIIQLKSTVTYNENYVSYFSKGYKNVKVTYKHGFNNVPTIISTLATLLMAKKVKISEQNTDADGLKSFTAGNYSESRDLSFINVKTEFDNDINSYMKKAKILYYLE